MTAATGPAREPDPRPPAPAARAPSPPVPTWRLAVAAAVAAVGVLVIPIDPRMTMVVLNGALLVAATVDALRAVRPEDLGVAREVPGVVPLDGRAEVVWRLTNPTPRPLRVRLADALAPSLRATTRRARLAVPAGAARSAAADGRSAKGRAAARTAINPSRRGRFELAEITLRVEGPWGLTARQGRRSLAGVVRVYPPFRSRQEAELRLTNPRLLEVGLRSARGRGAGTDFDSLREYGVDDEFRRIDWAATARAGKPIVRTYRAERNQTVLLLLDAGRTMAGRVPWALDPRPGSPPSPPRSPTQSRARGDDGAGVAAPGADVPRLDHAMDAVMMLTAVATRLGDRAGLVAFADRVRAVVPPGHGRDQLSRVTEAMYALEPELVESDYRGAFAQTLGRFRRRALLVVFTELAEQAVSETLLPALPLVLRSHVVLIAAVRDPAVQRWARSVPTEAGTSYRKAAAVQALQRRRRIVGQLRALGAIVVDAPPGRLAPDLADAYLRVKAIGRL